MSRSKNITILVSPLVLSALLSLFFLFMIGCRTKDKATQVLSDNFSEALPLSEYYYLPSPSEYILNPLPDIVERNKNELAKELLSNPDINLKEEVLEHFELKSKKVIGEIFQSLP